MSSSYCESAIVERLATFGESSQLQCAREKMLRLKKETVKQLVRKRSVEFGKTLFHLLQNNRLIVKSCLIVTKRIRSEIDIIVQ